MSKVKKKKRSALRMAYIQTRLVKKDVHPVFLPLYNHLINLARNSEKYGNNKHAGIELRKARELAGRVPAPVSIQELIERETPGTEAYKYTRARRLHPKTAAKWGIPLSRI